MMNIEQASHLTMQLQGLRPAAWAESALRALSDDSIEFLGNDGVPASSPAGDLVRLYQVRLERRGSMGTDQTGCAELIDRLLLLRADETVYVFPFSNHASYVTAFVAENGTMVGCITLSRGDKAGPGE